MGLLDVTGVAAFTGPVDSDQLNHFSGVKCPSALWDPQEREGRADDQIPASGQPCREAGESR